MTGPITGGCQCGAVRFRVDGALGRASICHCRMCQKAFGAFYGPLVSVRLAELTWTRGERATFQSSNKVRRGFCRDCGTPLTFECSDEVIDLAIGAFDDPSPIKPQVQLATDRALPWVHEIPDVRRIEVGGSQTLSEHHGSIVSYQHPDHDTAEWPPR
ncbi:GFA family protein [Phenylobacterium terrae]|uniref:GFA family protein n=1 Tax=Phenylobacterium terrae TaxID=2665495 RepID=A0ABW4N0K8_9CAUL